MSRRDTIIIAVLVNAALLMILFATAIRSDSPKEDTQKARSIQLADSAVQKPLEARTSEDILNEFVTSVPTLAESDSENVLTFDETALALAVPVVESVETAPARAPSPVETPKSAPKAKQEEGLVSVTVKKGDFLEKIAKANNTTVAAIMEANHLSSTQLKVGQVLKIPLGEGKKIAQKSSSTHTASNSSEVEYYTVKEGDSPWLIASRNKIKLEDLLRLNNLDEQKAKRLRPGDKLKIR